MTKKKIVIISVLVLLTQIQFIPMPFNCDEIYYNLFKWDFYFVVRTGLILVILFLVHRWFKFRYVFIFLLLFVPEFFKTERRIICSKFFVLVNKNKTEDFFNPFLGLKKLPNGTYSWGLTGFMEKGAFVKYELLIYEPKPKMTDSYNCKLINKNWYLYYDEF